MNRASIAVELKVEQGARRDDNIDRVRAVAAI